MTTQDGAREAWRPGRFIGRYRLIRYLGGGGMGEVWLAELQGMGGFRKRVALKRLLADSSDGSAVRMFLAEARLAALLSHPNCISVLDIAWWAGAPYIVMEHLPSVDFKRVLARLAALDTPHAALAAYVVREVLRGLAHAHALTDEAGRPLGVVHRDVSPANIAVCFDGSVKLIDFGLARVQGGEPTAAGVLKGKLAYLSPEQLDGTPVDQRADLWSAGVCLFEAATGTRLFYGRDDVDTLARVRAGRVPPPSERNAEVSRALAAVIQKALASDAGARYPDAAVMAGDLDEVVASYRWSREHTAGLMRALFPEAGSALCDEVTMPKAARAAARSSRRDRFLLPLLVAAALGSGAALLGLAHADTTAVTATGELLVPAR